MDDLFLDGAFCHLSLPARLPIDPRPPPLRPSAALGISAEVEQKGMKGSKKKRGLKLGEDFNVRRSSFVVLSSLVLIILARTLVISSRY